MHVASTDVESWTLMNVDRDADFELVAAKSVDNVVRVGARIRVNFRADELHNDE